MTSNQLSSLFFTLFLLISLTQCSNNHKSVVEFPQNRWHQTTVLNLNYKPTTGNTTKSIAIDLSYVYGSQFAEIPLVVYITSPTHQIDSIPFSLRLFDKNNNELGDCIGDYCDLKITMIANYHFDSPGVYNIKVLHKFDNTYLPNIISAAVSLE